jgi:class 3 adenylate cyclase
VAWARLLLGLAYRADGDEDGARDELEAARAGFERLGAPLDAQRVSELLGETPTRRTFVFTDIVDSTRLADVLGDEKWRRILAWHDRTVREIVAAHGGEITKHTGDGFFVTFDAPGAALSAAVDVQRALAAARPGEILVSRATLADGVAGFVTTPPRTLAPKGLEPLEVVGVDWR